MGLAENRGPYYSTLNSRILIIRTPNKVPLIFGNSHIIREIIIKCLGLGVQGNTETCFPPRIYDSALEP